MSDAQISNELQLVINKFLCCVPVSDIDLKDCLSSISWNEQAILVDQTINNKIVKQYPIKNSYQRTFLKNVIDILEKNFVEIHDNLYDTYCNLLSVEDKEKYFYKHYNIDKEIITLKENKNFISEGTTGLCSWQASLALSQWCLDNKEYLEKRVILELGSGVGLVGLTALFNCKPKEFYWSDCHPKVLEVLSENIRLNIGAKEQKEDSAPTVYTTKHTNKSSGKLIDCVITGLKTKNCDSIHRESKDTIETFRDFDSIKSATDFEDTSCGSYTIKETFDTKISRDENYAVTETLSACSDSILYSSLFENTKVCVINLPWESVLENQEYNKIKPDLVLAADVVYDNSVFKPLCSAVNFFLSSNKKCEVIFACTERNTDTLQEFLQLLESNGLYVNKLLAPKPDKFFWSTDVSIRFYRITAK